MGGAATLNPGTSFPRALTGWIFSHYDSTGRSNEPPAIIIWTGLPFARLTH